eukprot:9483802-Pyramimonas_sp.AAC.1
MDVRAPIAGVGDPEGMLRSVADADAEQQACTSQRSSAPINVYVKGNTGYVWCPNGRLNDCTNTLAPALATVLFATEKPRLNTRILGPKTQGEVSSPLPNSLSQMHA